MSDDQDSYKLWKRMVPYMYDWFTSHNLTWPSLSCRYATSTHTLMSPHHGRWGPVDPSGDKTYKRKQRLYLSEQARGEIESNTL